jgi:hypothetical protein
MASTMSKEQVRLRLCLSANVTAPFLFSRSCSAWPRSGKSLPGAGSRTAPKAVLSTSPPTRAAAGGWFRSRCSGSRVRICLSETSASGCVGWNVARARICCSHAMRSRFGRKLTQRELQDRNLDGEEAEELAGEISRRVCVLFQCIICFCILMSPFMIHVCLFCDLLAGTQRRLLLRKLQRNRQPSKKRWVKRMRVKLLRLAARGATKPLASSTSL